MPRSSGEEGREGEGGCSAAKCRILAARTCGETHLCHRDTTEEEVGDEEYVGGALTFPCSAAGVARAGEVL